MLGDSEIHMRQYANIYLSIMHLNYFHPLASSVGRFRTRGLKIPRLSIPSLSSLRNTGGYLGFRRRHPEILFLWSQLITQHY